MAKKKKNMYFKNDEVEELLNEYVERGCVDIELRDNIMKHADELIRQIIRAHNFEHIFPGRDQSSFGELFQVAWCVNPDSIIITNNGIKPISKIKNDELVYGKNSLESYSGYVKLGSSETKIITTKYGYSLEASLDHPMPVVREGVEKRISFDNIKVGDLLKVQYGQQIFGSNVYIDFKPKTTGGTTTLWNPPEEWNEELAYIIGLIVSEGSWEDYRVTIYNDSNEVEKLLLNNNQGLIFRNTKCRGSRFVFGSKRFAEFVRWLGLDVGCDNKKIPRQLLEAPKNILISFLKGMFDGDGHSNKRNGLIGYTSTSIKLINELKILLLNFGILTKTSKLNRDHTFTPDKNGGYKKSKSKQSYQLLLSSIDSAKFYNIIGFNISRKQNNEKMLTSKPFRQIYVDLRNLFILNKKLMNEHGFNSYRIINLKSYPHEETCKKLSNIIPEISKFVDNKFIWLPVIDIKHSESEVVDIEVPVSGMFNVNGISSYNCQIEKTLYKYDNGPNSPKLFNMWCVSPDTNIFTEDGIKSISDAIDDNNLKTYGIDGITDIIARTRKDSRKVNSIITECNYEITCTPEHLLYRLGPNGPEWVRTCNIKENDLVGIQYNQNTFVNDNNINFNDERWSISKITEELAYIIGL